MLNIYHKKGTEEVKILYIWQDSCFMYFIQRDVKNYYLIAGVRFPLILRICFDDIT